MLSDEELLIVLRRLIDFDREQKAIAIDCSGLISYRLSHNMPGSHRREVEV